jgi:ubiquinone/menaquinone biosynthesis C-methylase UbiE
MKKQEGSKFVPALGFHWLTPYYDLVIGTTLREQMFKMALIEQSRLENNHRVLDLASGTGTLSIWLKQRQPLANVIDVDSDPAIISIAAAKAQKANVSIRFDHALSCNLPYPEAHFDRVVSSLFSHHLTWENKERTVKELFRVIKPGGELHVADWGKAENFLMR